MCCHFPPLSPQAVHGAVGAQATSGGLLGARRLLAEGATSAHPARFAERLALHNPGVPLAAPSQIAFPICQSHQQPAIAFTHILEGRLGMNCLLNKLPNATPWEQHLPHIPETQIISLQPMNKRFRNSPDKVTQ